MITEEVDLQKLFAIVSEGKWVIITTILLFASISIVSGLASENWYRSEVLLVPADDPSEVDLGGQLGGLAALAGVSGGGTKAAEALAILESRHFIGEFIESQNLMELLYNSRRNFPNVGFFWRNEDGPDIREEVEYFQEYVLDVSESRDTGFITLRIDWIDAEVAAKWAQSLVDRLNSRSRNRALEEAHANIDYLQAELETTSIVTMQQSISRLLENELQKLMLARASQEFAFRIIDPAHVPKDPVKPRRVLLFIVAVILGAAISLFFILFFHALRNGLPPRENRAFASKTEKSEKEVEQ